MNSTQQKLRVWWVPQVPMKPFRVDVSTVEEGVKVLEVLAEYDKFQYINNVKPDYCNAGGLEVFDLKDTTDSPNGTWCDWFIETEYNYFDDPEEYVEWKNNGGY